MELEGELYQIREYAERVVNGVLKRGDWIEKCIKDRGRDDVIDNLARIMRRRLGDEDSGTFKITVQGLSDSIDECRDYYWDMCIIELLSKDAITIYLDKEGQVRVGIRKETK